MEYRSRFELQQQALEEARAAHSLASSSSLSAASRRAAAAAAASSSSSLASGDAGLYTSSANSGLSSTTTTSLSSLSLSAANTGGGGHGHGYGGKSHGKGRGGGGIVGSSSSNSNSSNNTSSSNNAAAALAAAAAAASSSSSSLPFMPSTSLPDDPTALVREVPGAENLAAMAAAVERAEAVQRYMEKANLSLEESARYIMANGSTGQKLSFFSHLRESLEVVDHRRLSRVLDILLDSMWTQDPELQCQAPLHLLDFLGLANSAVAGQLLDVTRTMLTVKTAAVRVAWGKLLLGLVVCLTPEQLERDVVALAVKKAEHAEPQDQRELSCDVLGRVCGYLPRDKVEQLVLPRALALCQDTNVGVRQRICLQLGVIARTLGAEAAKVKVAPDLFELLNDEERAVSRTAFSCLIDLVEFFGSAYRTEKLYPIIKRYVSNPPSEVVCLLVGEFGRFVYEIQNDIVACDDVDLFASFYEAATQKPEEEARRHCAYYLPAVVASLPLSVFAPHLSPCLNRLASDASVPVRRCIAAGLHELVPLLGGSAAAQLERPFLTLLADSNTQVLSLFLRHASVLLDCFVEQLHSGSSSSGSSGSSGSNSGGSSSSGSSGSARGTFFRSVTSILLRQMPTGCSHWRVAESIIALVTQYMPYFSDAALMDAFTPALLEYMVSGASVLREACARLVVQSLLRSSNVPAKVQLLARLNNEYARSSSCYKRCCYLYVMREMCAVTSRRCVRERLLECAMELHRDPVVRVRVLLARCVASLAKALRPHNPGTLEEEFANMLQRLLMDDDADVRAAAQQSSERIAQQERERRRGSGVAGGGGGGGGRSSSEQQQQQQQQDDLLDQRREKAEQEMLDMAKESDKAERRAKLRDMLKLERNRESGERGVLLSGGSATPVPASRRCGGLSAATAVSSNGIGSSSSGGNATTTSAMSQRTRSGERRALLASNGVSRLGHTRVPNSYVTGSTRKR